jgi:hypothetical protein
MNYGTEVAQSGEMRQVFCNKKLRRNLVKNSPLAVNRQSRP